MRILWTLLLCATLHATDEEGPLALITLKLRDAPLRQAVTEIGKQAKVTFVYGDNLLEGIQVSCNFNDTHAQQALLELLEKTTLSHRWVSQKRVVIYSKQSAGLMDIEGTVYGDNNLPLPGALLWCGEQVVHSDAIGRFVFRNVPRGKALIRASAPGFLSQTVEAQQQWHGRIDLQAAPTLSEHISVSTTMRQALSVSEDSGELLFSPQALAAQGAPVTDLFDSLRKLPGLDMQELGGTGMSIRGSAPSETLVMVDGIKLYQVDHTMGYTSAVHSGAIAGARIFKGAPPARYGDRTAGVIDLSTPQEPIQAFHGEAGVRGDYLHAVIETPLTSKLALMTSMRRSYRKSDANAVYDRVFQRTFNVENDDFSEYDEIRSDRYLDFDDAIVSLRMQATKRDQLKVTWYRGWDRSGENIDIDFDGPWEVAYDRKGAWGNHGLSAQWERRWNENATSKIWASTSKYETDFDINYVEDFEERDLNNWRIYNSLKDTVYNGLHQWQIGNHTLEFGFNRTFIESGIREGWNESNWSWNISTDQTVLFIEDTWLVRDDLGLTIGVRQQDNRLSGMLATEPRMAAFWEVSPGVKLRAGYSQHHQAILRSPDTLNYFEGVETWFLADGDEVNDGFSEHSQLGLHAQSGPWLTEIWAYRKRHNGVIARIFDPLGERPEITQSVDHIEGAEMFLRYRRHPFTAEIGYAYRKARVIRDYRTGEALDYPTDRDTPHQIKLGLYFQRGAYQADLSWRYSSGRPYGIPSIQEIIEDEELIASGNGSYHGKRSQALSTLFKRRQEYTLGLPEFPNGERLPATHQMDVAFRRLFTWRSTAWEVGLRCTNLYDRDNILYRYYDLDEEELEVFPIDVTGFGIKPMLDINVRF